MLLIMEGNVRTMSYMHKNLRQNYRIESNGKILNLESMKCYTYPSISISICIYLYL